MAANAKLTAEDLSNNAMIMEMELGGKCVLYSSIVGSLIYVMMGTQPDITYVVGVLRCYSAAPKHHHWSAVKWVLCYLNLTADMELRFDSNDVSMDMPFHSYSDVDWSGDPDTSRSTSSHMFLSAQGAIGWASKQQTMVALSSTESEYIGLCYMCQHLAWL